MCEGGCDWDGNKKLNLTFMDEDFENSFKEIKWLINC